MLSSNTRRETCREALDERTEAATIGQRVGHEIHKRWRGPLGKGSGTRSACEPVPSATANL